MLDFLKALWDAIFISPDYTEPVVNHPMNQEPVVPDPDALGADWSNVIVAHHNVRVLCDLEGLTYDQKEILTACVFVESAFHIDAKHENKDGQGHVLSTDWGVVQVNDFYHIGEGKDFPSVQYVLENPEACVRWMCGYYKLHGNLDAWVSFTSGAYKLHLGKV